MIATVRPVLAIPLVLLAACGRELEDGRYAFTPTEVIQDSCGEEPRPVPTLPDGDLDVDGETVRLEFLPDGGESVPGLERLQRDDAMLGRFLPDRDVERFIADATFDVVREIQGLSCLTFAQVHLEAVIESDTSFAGTLRVDYARRQEAQPECLPACVVEVAFRAEHR